MPIRARSQTERPRLRPQPVVHVLDVDPDLGSELRGARLAEARARLVARVHHAGEGLWEAAALQRAAPGHLGLLVLEGVIARELLIDDNVSTELLGEGDLIRPWQQSTPSRLLRSEVRWTVIQPARFALLGPSFAAVLADYPEVNAMLVDRVTERSHRLAMTQAISQLNGVDRRILALLWHLAERWGRVMGEGVVVPLILPHRVIAQQVGARRPTVSTAISRLIERGAVERRLDGTWLLRGEPVGLPTEATARVVRLRRRHAHEEGRTAGCG